MTPKLFPPEFFDVVAKPISCTRKIPVFQVYVLTRNGLHENYVVSRKLIPPELLMYVIFWGAGHCAQEADFIECGCFGKV